MKKFVFDLDGVLRDLNGYLVQVYGGEYPQCWNWEYGGMHIGDAIRKDGYRALVQSPPTHFLKVADGLNAIYEIWTVQPYIWRELTTEWVKRWIGSACLRFFHSSGEKRRMLDQYKDYILIEDSPNFENYERIVLVDYPYNQGVDAQRIKTPGDLDNLIRER